MRGLVETIYFTNTSGISEFLAVDMDDGSRVRMRGFLLRPKSARSSVLRIWQRTRMAVPYLRARTCC